MTKRRHNRDKEVESNFSMLAGIEDFLAKEKKKKEKKTTVKKASSGRKAHKKSLKGSGRTKSSDKPTKQRPSAKKLDANMPARTRTSYLGDMSSMMSGNIYETANRNMDRPNLATVTDTRKDKALQTLLAGVPLEDRQEARGQKADITRASKVLSYRRVSADGQGN